jgi:hypothetical protein
MLLTAVPLIAGVHAANAKSTVPSEVGHCVFSAAVATPALQATFSPDLASIVGDGYCVVNAGYMEPVYVDLSGGSGLTCVGGTENMSGQLTFSGVTGNQPVTATAVGEPGAIQLVIQGSVFVADASLAYVDSPCPGSLTADLTGHMSFET